MDESQGFWRVIRVGGRTLADLVLPVACVSCAAPGDVLCRQCAEQVRCQSGQSRILPDGLEVHWAATYGGIVRDAILGSKRTGDVGLTGLLSRLAAQTLMDIMSAASTGKTGPLSTLLVPVHSGSKTTRSAGADLGLALADRATATARANGFPVRVANLLVVSHKHGSQKALAKAQRGANVAGSMTARSKASLRNPHRVILFDDVVTTGSTLMEAHRALSQAAIPVHCAVTIACTRAQHL